MMYYYNDYYPMHSFFGPFFMIIIWALIIWAIVSMIKRFGSFNNSSNSKAIDILKERYAKGEITKDQFEAVKKDLE